MRAFRARTNIKNDNENKNIVVKNDDDIDQTFDDIKKNEFDLINFIKNIVRLKIIFAILLIIEIKIHVKTINKSNFKKLNIFNKHERFDFENELDKFVAIIVDDKKKRQFTIIQSFINEIDVIKFFRFVFYCQDVSNFFNKKFDFDNLLNVEIETHAKNNTNTFIVISSDFLIFSAEIEELVFLNVVEEIQNFQTILHVAFSNDVLTDIAKKKNFVETIQTAVENFLDAHDRSKKNVTKK